MASGGARGDDDDVTTTSPERHGRPRSLEVMPTMPRQRPWSEPLAPDADLTYRPEPDGDTPSAARTLAAPLFVVLVVLAIAIALLVF